MTVDPDLVGQLAARLDAAGEPRLGRGLALYVVTAGDCGGCALEWALLRSAAHGLAPYGISVVDTPAAADVLLMVGALTRTLAPAIRAAYDGMAPPRWVVAIGDCALDGGPFAPSPAIAGGLEAAVPVDLAIPGCPPTPETLLIGLETLLAANV